MNLIDIRTVGRKEGSYVWLNCRYCESNKVEIEDNYDISKEDKEKYGSNREIDFIRISKCNNCEREQREIFYKTECLFGEGC